MRTVLLVLLSLALLIAVLCQAAPPVPGDARGIDPLTGSARSILPEVYTLALLVVGDATIFGSLCVTGAVHLNNPPNDPSDATHIICDARITVDRVITPPPIFTDPAHFPGATYYYVKGSKTTSPYESRIYDANGTDITGPNAMTDVTTYTSSTKTFTYNFTSAALVAKYFDESTGVFKKNAGDSSVVVNFGEAPVVNPPGSAGVSAITFYAGGASTVRATVVNARYIGPVSPDSLRTIAGNWMGARIAANQIVFEPRNGLAIVAYDLEKQGSSHVDLGTPAFPGLVYVTHDVVELKSNSSLRGGLICQGDFHNTGNPELTYDSGFLCRLPDYLNPCPLPAGACCVPGGTCSIVTAVDCAGLWLGAETTCDPNPCLVGACCLPGGLCQDMPPDQCSGFGGYYMGGGTRCAANPCSRIGACCWPDGGCSLGTEAYCFGGAGTYKGDGTQCNPDSCSASSIGDGSRSQSSLRLAVISNPSAGEVGLAYRLPAATTVVIEIFSAGGALVRRIAEGAQSAGPHTVRWNALDSAGHPVASGAYLVRISTPEGSRATKLVVAR